ncbi:uncharacterized protein Z520_10063 [Fonsecaea multimorphosa CBS 102226]|uniref:Cytochrome b5 heme-binding domain-containing protein n=1 Tax=Fonsecaea multimorphosa CBS 102226 TaxID=1442371 RepID=A0A0D2KCB4_9EURO|nr:uncharacterized protein Z520_10063 [Fonsecaea multimorphosa CBS 102226]KIX94353.1 hypothetical protein Z520_10063 [Fonsecaea multimorphosa CBS 102226]OAL19685.1 hypothetical protein AYO22_09557 [Fonsecaea multimorphosa]
MSPTFTLSEVDAHSSNKDLYLIVHGKVHNVTDFIDQHPGGREKLLETGGSDVTELFENAAHSEDARSLLSEMYIGDLLPEENSKPARKSVERRLPTNADGIPSVWLYTICVVVLLIALAVYQKSELLP